MTPPLPDTHALNGPRPIALVGPTASGKSGVALWLADELARLWQQETPLEIISVDSALVYRGMDIGTAKPTPAELARVPHHLIDIRDPAQAYSAAEFAADARRLIADIHARGRHALLVGGTLLYLKALLEPMDDLPPAQPELRAVIDAQAREQGWPALHAELAQVDPITAQRLSPNDSQRIGRALEVYRATGQPLSALHTRTARTEADTPPAELPMPVISLEPTDRAWLHQRIAQRFEQMLAQGLLDEVHTLMQRPDLHADLPSMRCVGYRQAWEEMQWIQEHSALTNKALEAKNIRNIRETGTAATRQLAKRQLTWLRSMPGRWVEACDQPDLPQRVLARVRSVWG
ncbi:MAG TPA: tRNA (adenosine(37)-N6)-dimethylallyltransferase MiaA [Burkholderiaceae bacterium]|nr:tRNA (adenosine(37)-N6)-dimethylallyltransferase MiaA [Burkholderiaceae bacterium]